MFYHTLSSLILTVRGLDLVVDTILRDPLSAATWSLIISANGAVAVVASEDLEDRNLCLCIVYRADIGHLEARRITTTMRLQSAYMSANHRIKAGESGGVG
jgi:hypothetical protein